MVYTCIGEHMRLTFKKQPKDTGLAAVAAYEQETDIKADGKVVGHISYSYNNSATKGDSFWHISLAVKKEKTAEEPAAWKWIRLKKTTATEPEAREFVKAMWEKITTELDLYQFED